MDRPQAASELEAESSVEDESAPPTVRDPRRLARGAVLAGKYRLELLLGEGGMAVVWSAYDLVERGPVAIKLLRDGQNSRLLERLKLEARAAARITHPAIVKVLDAATTDAADPFIVMELLSGETLTDYVARERPSALRIVQLLLPIVDVLGKAHDHGVVHRDVKPDNVFLSSEGSSLQPKLLDFGIAHLSGEALEVPRLTDKGIALGSPTYMSPEQARGEIVDYRSDIWSFCVLLYRVLGGKAPFTGRDTRGILDSVLTDEPPPLPLGAGVDGHLARIVLSGLSKDPAGRPATARNLGQQLARWLLLHGVHVDACGTSLVGKWLTSDAPPKGRRPPVPRRKSAPPPPVRGDASAAASGEPAGGPEPPTTPVPALATPHGSVERRRGSARWLSRGVPAKPRRWALWALAGTLIAGASLALTKHQRVAEPLATRSPVTTVAASEPLPAPPSEPELLPLAPPEVVAVTVEGAGPAPMGPPASAPPRVKAPQRVRSTLPF